MKIRLGESEHLDHLLWFLRDGGCIAYTTSEPELIDAVHPDALGEDQLTIRALLDSRLAGRPLASAQLDVS